MNDYEASVWLGLVLFTTLLLLLSVLSYYVARWLLRHFTYHAEPLSGAPGVGWPFCDRKGCKRDERTGNKIKP